MIRIVLGLIGGFFVWAIAWFGGEKILSVIWPTFGVQQAAFQAAIENGPDPSGFTAGTAMLVTHIILGSIVSVMAGLFAALIAGENKRAPLILGFLLLALGLLKVAMSWQHVPIWYTFIFTAILLPMAIMGGRMKTDP